MIQSAPPPERFAILWHAMPAAAAAIPSEGDTLADEPSAVRSLPSIAVRTSHFDLLLQVDETALTWELPRLPMQGESLPVQRLADHRLHYLDYEGPLSEGRGQVVAWDRGRLIWQIRGDGRVQGLLFGERLTAQLLLEEEAEQPKDWRLTAKMWQVDAEA